jgi:hypothetical protein
VKNQLYHIKSFPPYKVTELPDITNEIPPTRSQISAIARELGPLWNGIRYRLQQYSPEMQARFIYEDPAYLRYKDVISKVMKYLD